MEYGVAQFVPFAGGKSRGRMPIRRALSQSDVSGTLIQPLIDPIIEDLIRVHNPLWFLLPRRPGSGAQANINQRTARGSSQWVDDTEEPTDQESTYGPQLHFPYKTLLYRGKVTRFAQAITRNYIQLLAEEIVSGVQELKDKWENTFLNGDATTNAKEFSGLEKLMPSGQKIEIATNGGALSLIKIDESIDLLYGVPTFGMYTQRTKRQLNALLQVQQRFVNTVQTDGGFNVPSYNDIPLVWTQWISNTQTHGTSTDCSSIYWVNTGKVYADDLTPLFRMPLARTSSQWEAFDLGMDTVLVSRNEKYISELTGIRA